MKTLQTTLVMLALIIFQASVDAQNNSPGEVAKHEYLLNRATELSDIVIVCPFSVKQQRVSEQAVKNICEGTVVGVLKGKHVFGEHIQFEKVEESFSEFIPLGKLRILMFNKGGGATITIQNGEMPEYSDKLASLLKK